MEGVAPRGGRPADDPETEALRDAFDALQGAISRAKLYGPNHPQTRTATQVAHGKLSRIVDEFGNITVTTSAEGLVWKGKAITDEREDRVGIGRHVHIEGISQLTFTPGLTIAEVEQFAAAMRVNLSLPQFEEETLESLLFQAELKNVTFRAINELMDAEAASGRDGSEGRRLELARKMLELQEGDRQAGRHLNAKKGALSAEIVDKWELEGEANLDRLSDDDWRERFVAEAGDDAAAIDALRSAVRDERESQWLGRAALILLRAAVARRPEVPPATADSLLLAAGRQLYQSGDPVGILDVLEGGHALAAENMEREDGAGQWTRDQLRRLYAPMRVARMLRVLDPGVPLERRALDRFLAILPDTAILALFDGLSKEEDPTALAPLARYVLDVARPRVAAWLERAEQLPGEQLVPIVHMARIANDDLLAPLRARCLRHSASGVREATLEWYFVSLGEQDAKAVTALLVDRAPNVRDAATRVLARHKPQDAVRMLQKTLTGDAFAELDPELKTDLCVAYAKVGGPTALTLLSELLNARTGLFRSDADVATVQAAAHGLGAVGTANALRTLEAAARGLPSARKTAALVAIGALESQRAAHDAKPDGSR